MMHIIDVTEKGNEYTIDTCLRKNDALVRGRELVKKENLKIDIYDSMNRFKTIELRPTD